MGGGEENIEQRESFNQFKHIEKEEDNKPHCCPVCSGKGLVPNGFYLAVGIDNYSTSSITPDTCRSCNGEGIVWSKN